MAHSPGRQALVRVSAVANQSPTLIFRPDTIVDRLRWGQVFPVAQPVEVELGSGDGSFMAQWAQQHPTINFLGVERLLGRLKKLDRRGQRAGLKNLRLIRLEASYLLQYLIPANSISALHIYFPDPWPKRKHRDRRLINEAFTRQAEQALVPGGIVWLRTDNVDYFEQMVASFQTNPHFIPIPTPEDLAATTTDFERHFNAQGIPTQRAGYQLGAVG